MAINPLNEISAVYVQEVLKPQLGKNIAKEKPPVGGGEKKEGDASDGSAKRIRQAVYDIRYRARREEIPVQQAYGQYMSHTTMTGPEKSEVKSKLGEEKVTEEVEEKKFQVRVTDKNSGKSYVRMATREKINQLRSNSNISSVEMTKYGTPYEGERKRGKQTASVTSGKGLDPVGHEDKDIDNDGDHDKNDKYLLNRRKVRGAAIGKRVTKENFSNWREDLYEIVDKIEKEKSDKKIVEKNINNKINVHPKMNEAIEAIGGQLIEMVEIEEGMSMKDFKSNRKKNVRRAASVDAEKRGHVGKEWYNTGNKYSPDEAKSGRANMSDDDRAARHRSAVDPDDDRDENTYSADKTKNPKKLRKQKAMGESAVPGKPAEKLGAVTSIPKDEQDAARQRTLAKAAAMRAKKLNKEELELDEAITSEKGKAKAAEMIAKRSTPSGRAKSGQGASVAAIKHISRANVENLSGTPATPTIAKNPVKSRSYGGTGNKAARRAAELSKEEFELDEKTLTSAETKKREEIVKSMKKSAGDFEKRYPGRGKEVMYATATKQAKRVAEAVGQMPGRETTPPSGTTAKQDDIQKRQVTNAAEKQKLANLKTMQQKQQMLQRQKLNLQKQGKLPLNAEEVEHIDELNRYEKETGKDYKTGKSVTKGGTMGGNDSNSKVMRHMHKVMGAGRMGAGGPIQPRGKGKVPGQKPPAAGEYGSERRSPEQIVKNRRVARQQGRDNMSSRFD
jgi:hypothetical protein